MKKINGVFLEEGDLIGNPLVSSLITQDSEGKFIVEPTFVPSKGGTWSVNHGLDGVYTDLSLYCIHEIRKNVFQRIMNPKRIRGYRTPISIEEILRQEYAIEISVKDIGFSDEIREQIQGTSYEAQKIFQVTSKKESGKHLIGIRDIGGGRRKKTRSFQEQTLGGLQPLPV